MYTFNYLNTYICISKENIDSTACIWLKVSFAQWRKALIWIQNYNFDAMIWLLVKQTNKTKKKKNPKKLKTKNPLYSFSFLTREKKSKMSIVWASVRTQRSFSFLYSSMGFI